MPKSTKPGWIDWVSCRTKETIIEDLTNEVIPLNTKPEDAWNDWCSHMWEVKEEKVVFDQFKAAFSRHKKQVSDKKKESLKEKKLLERHRKLHPSSKYKADGSVHFYKHKAYEL